MYLPRFYPILDTALLQRTQLSAVEAAAVLIDAGARILQFRHKEHFSRDVFDTAADIAALCAQANVLFIINDRADMAALLGAALHLGQDDLSPADARKLLPPDRPIGLSTHNREQVAAALQQPVQYLALGPIFQTATKHDLDPVVGLDELRALRPSFRHPLAAIGGITRANAAAVWEAGADSAAVIGDLFEAPCSAAALHQRAAEWIALAEKFENQKGKS